MRDEHVFGLFQRCDGPDDTGARAVGDEISLNILRKLKNNLVKMVQKWYYFHKR